MSSASAPETTAADDGAGSASDEHKDARRVAIVLGIISFAIGVFVSFLCGSPSALEAGMTRLGGIVVTVVLVLVAAFAHVLCYSGKYATVTLCVTSMSLFGLVGFLVS